MTQHYPTPNEVDTSLAFRPWPSRSLKRIIERDGLIVPILVRVVDGRYVAADANQAERVMACAELGFETVLVETDWTEEDL
jgi:ParB-like chromosome segregation protein Spo0J